MNTQDIANFAENLLGNKVDEVKQTGQAPLPVTDMNGSAPDAPDISHVRVTDDFQSRVLSESFNVSVKDNALEEEANYKKRLMESYEQKLFELEELIAEMSTVGMMGPGTAGGPPIGGSPKRQSTPSEPKRRRGGAGRSARNFRTNR